MEKIASASQLLLQKQNLQNQVSKFKVYVRVVYKTKNPELLKVRDS